MLECCKSVGVAVAFTRLADSVRGLYPDELHLVKQVIRPWEHHGSHGVKETMDRIRSFLI